MSTISNSVSNETLDEYDRQKKRAEMIRQYLQATNCDINSIALEPATSDTEHYSSLKRSALSLSVFNFDEVRKDLKAAEDRVERLREEVKEMQKRRDEPISKTPPPYIPPSTSNTNYDGTHNNLSTSSLLHENFLFNSQQNGRQLFNSSIVSPLSVPNMNSSVHLSSVSADLTKDHLQKQFIMKMRQHREQLIVYIESLKQVLQSLDNLMSFESTKNEIHLANMKLDTIQQKSRQLRALKSNRSSQRSSPFIECRIRQLEHDLVYMLSEHQKDVQNKLELNEQRSLMLFKIIQTTDELNTIDHQIQQILSSTSSNETNQHESSRTSSSKVNSDGRHVLFREPADINSMIKLNNPHYHFS